METEKPFNWKKKSEPEMAKEENNRRMRRIMERKLSSQATKYFIHSSTVLIKRQTRFKWQNKTLKRKGQAHYTSQLT